MLDICKLFQVSKENFDLVVNFKVIFLDGIDLVTLGKVVMKHVVTKDGSQELEGEEVSAFKVTRRDDSYLIHSKN